MIRTAESVTEGHPDKVCDQISDALLDAYLEQDPLSRVAIESFGCHGLMVIGGEVTSNAENIDAKDLARKLYHDLGYENDLEIITRIVKQSPDIAQGVDVGGAGDQGIMYGYATSETPELMPKPVILAHKLVQGLANLRKKQNPGFGWLRPDGKTQVTMVGDKVKNVLISTQHAADISQPEIKEGLTKELIEPIIGDLNGVEVLVNPTGKFVVGGFESDTGLTGRKIMVDTYGGLAPHGGGCFSGKDPTKVDRSAAYMARRVARDLLQKFGLRECQVALAYAIGRAEPLMVTVRTPQFRKDLADYARNNYDLTPKGIIEFLNLRKPIYRNTACYGHFGRPGFKWEE